MNVHSKRTSTVYYLLDPPSTHKKCVLCTPEVQYFFFDVPEMMTLIATTLVTSLSFGGWESSPTDVALYPSDDTNGVLCRRRCGERTCWGVSFLDREQGSGGAWNFFFVVVFNEKLGSIKIYLLVGGLEHLDCFPIYWECDNPN
jgi:hypothetical protein